MGAKWRLAVEEFGRIERADVEIRPLTLFVGENNSGKSYLATLLWGLLTVGGSLESRRGPALAACERWAKEHLPPAVPQFDRTLTADEIAMFQRSFDEALDAGKGALLERLFRSKRVRARSIRFSTDSNESNILFKYDGQANVLDVADGTGARAGLSVSNEEGRESALSFLRNVSWQGDACLALEADKRTNDRFETGDPIFIPASRTGYMHLYREVVRARFGGGEQARPDGEGRLTLPAFHFLDFIAFGAKYGTGGPFEEACQIIESALSGNIELSPGRGANEVDYVMNGLASRFSMQLSSTLVSDLAPLLVVLRSAYPIPLLVLEEPESHLHPKLQRVLARAIVRLIRAGTCVVITTHSTTFCQQINNFIKLGSLPEDTRRQAQQTLGYENKDVLCADEVAAHHFDVGADGKTRVVELERTPAGIVMPPFNRELLKLQEEVLFLQDLLSKVDS